jgi:hypothetical protein
MLPVHTDPDATSSVLYNFAPEATGIRSTGISRKVAGHTWISVETPRGEGWVDARSVTEQIDNKAFGEDPRPGRLLARFVDAMASRRLDALQNIVSPDGLRVVRSGQVTIIPVQELTAENPLVQNLLSLSVTEDGAATPQTTPTATEDHGHTVTTLTVPTQIRNYHRLPDPSSGGTRWILFEHRDRKVWVAGILLDE